MNENDIIIAPSDWVVSDATIKVLGVGGGFRLFLCLGLAVYEGGVVGGKP